MKVLTKKEKQAHRARLAEIAATNKEEALESAELDLTLEKHEGENLCYYFKPYAWQNNASELLPKYNTIIISAPNKIGKTAWWVNILNSFCLGYEPWNEVGEDYPGAVKVKDTYYAPSKLGIKPPIQARVTGENWDDHLEPVVIRELLKWLPRGEYTTKKNQMGYNSRFFYKNGSQIDLLTYGKKDAVIESWMGDLWIPDEPPPQSWYSAMSRGIFGKGGKIIFPFTPLKEAWILDDLMLSGRADVGMLEGLLIYDNEAYSKHDNELLEKFGLSDTQREEFFDLLLYKNKKERKFVEDKGKKAFNFLEENMDSTYYDEMKDLKFLRIVQDTPPEEAPSRFGGVFKSLVGRVLKTFDKNIHWIEPFDVPTDWPVIAMIDFHLKTPQAISFHSASKQQAKYIIKEVWENLSPEEVADAIIRAKKANAWRLENVYIDPLSKGDTAYMRNRAGTNLQDSFSIIGDRLAEHDITLHVASKDKVSGVNNIQKELEGVNGKATYFIFNTCERHFFEIMRWVYDDDGKPIKKLDHFMENWYRATLADLEWEDLTPGALNYPEPKNAGPNTWLGG